MSDSFARMSAERLDEISRVSQAIPELLYEVARLRDELRKIKREIIFQLDKDRGCGNLDLLLQLVDDVDRSSVFDDDGSVAPGG